MASLRERTFNVKNGLKITIKEEVVQPRDKKGKVNHVTIHAKGSEKNYWKIKKVNLFTNSFFLKLSNDVPPSVKAAKKRK
jgi:hypothetical protein